jgi:hypothetical protein
METIKNLKKLHKKYGSWSRVAKNLGITYAYVCMLRNGLAPKKSLDILISILSED